MDTIEALGKHLSAQIQDGKSLLSVGRDFLSYNGVDWKNYQQFCTEKYQRNTAYADDHIEILVLCWCSHQESGVHDHPEGGCIVQVMDGELQEDMYRKMSLEEMKVAELLEMGDGEEKGEEIETDSLVKVREKMLLPGMISHQRGQYGLHNVRNLSDKPACTIHVYSPPHYRPTFFPMLPTKPSPVEVEVEHGLN